jgi:hypothetical protein
MIVARLASTKTCSDRKLIQEDALSERLLRMRTMCAVGALALIVLAVAGIAVQSAPATAQDRTDERIAALETQVADLEARVAALEKSGAPVSATEADSQGATSGAVTVNGVGSTISEDFHLDAGRYEVTLTLDSGCCISMFLYGQNGSDDLLFNEIFDFDVGGGTVTNIYQIPTTGAYFLDAQNTDGAWTVTFSPR